MTEIIGWFAAAILLVTMMRQVYKQWQDRRAEGVSHWLFIGQIAASVGFTIYSLLLGNTVFVVTNFLMLVNAILGLFIDRRNRRSKTASAAGPSNAATVQ